MIGQLVLTAGGRGRAAPDSLYGLPVLRAEVALEGFWGERRLRRACRALCRGRARRALVLREDGLWSRLEELGLRPVDPVPFLRAQAVPLALADLARQGLAPDRAVVALRGTRAGRDMVRTAQALCPLVRALIVDAPWGGAELAAWLREEFGIPILPGGEQGQTALRFQEGCPRPEAGSLDLYGPRPELAGLSLTAPALAEEDQAQLPLLAALWEGGRLAREDIKIT